MFGLFKFTSLIKLAAYLVLRAILILSFNQVQDNGSDLASVDDMRVASAAKKYNLHPVFHEVYGEAKTPNYAVAVVKKGSGYNKIDELRGKRYDQISNLRICDCGLKGK